ncbi:MAG TPA: bifunctional oligoribonuclease/PAP phosphatase NrnA [Vicinamibacterales bacterium]|nr:bifunctional oligoribonuclease/PAP phosphatase NrnA [Vicinamibacterales bacterium]
MAHPQPPAELLDTIRNGHRFIVASHQRPDGDAIGSAFAMALALRAMGKQATVVTDAIPAAFLQPFPEVSGIVITPEVGDTFDAALIMECSELSRTGVSGLDRSPVMNIDHHPGNRRYGTVNWIDESAAACGEMAFTIIEALGVALTKDIATHVYLAVLTDTGSFHFSHLSPRTYEIARRCVEAGADPQWIARTHYDSNTLARVRIFGAVMNGMVIVDEGRVALLSITRKTMEDLGGTNDDLEGLINFPLTVKDIEAVAFFKEVGDDDWRVSLRSKGNVDTGTIARAHGGGGHTNAAGCAARGPLDEVNKQFAQLLADAIRRK